MQPIALAARAASLQHAWHSEVIGRPAGINLKVLRMDDAAYPAECHPFEEALLVLDGQMNLEIGGEVIPVGPGQVFLVPAGVPHAVAPGSRGTLVILDA